MEQGDWNANGRGDVYECYGDCNCDGRVDELDTLLLKQELGRNDCNINSCKADCNDDGKVNSINSDIIRTQFSRSDCLPCL